MYIAGREVSIYEVLFGGGARWYWDARYLTEAEQIAAMPPLPEALLAEIEAALSRRFCDSVLSWSSRVLDQGQNEGVTLMSLPIPTEIVARFVSHDDDHATLTLKHETYFRHLTVVHEQIAGDIIGSEIDGVGITEQIAVAAGETLTFIARCSGYITGTLVVEVASEAEMLGYILAPKGGYGILLHQQGVLRIEELHRVEEAEVAPC